LIVNKEPLPDSPQMRLWQGFLQKPERYEFSFSP